jgi:hypothetical protein
MLKNLCEPAEAGHSDPDPERSEGEGEQSRSGNKGLARFLVVRQYEWRTPRNDRLNGFFSHLMKPFVAPFLALLTR